MSQYIFDHTNTRNTDVLINGEVSRRCVSIAVGEQNKATIFERPVTAKVTLYLTSNGERPLYSIFPKPTDWPDAYVRENVWVIDLIAEVRLVRRAA